MKKLVLLILLIAPFTILKAAGKNDVNSQLVLQAVPLNEPIVIDGHLTEDIWKNGPVITRFVQREPREGGAPTESTEVRIAYDDEAVYIGARMYDSSPDSIISRLGRRDADLSADLFGVFIDPYHDRRSGFYFGLNPAGTYYDGTLYNDDWDDSSWDGVWEGRTSVDSGGWTAEFRIPFSQLRFQKKSEYIWGINFRRDIERKQERDYLVYAPKDGSGFVSRFPELVGLRNISPARHFSILPYFRSKAAYIHPEEGNPFLKQDSYHQAFGGDLKYGIGSNLTLDMTINPDFGQVEVDPAVVNLSDVETFYQEKRPFFIEGSSIFEFGTGGSRSHWGFNWSTPGFFYSRRIGRKPQGSLPDNDYQQVPEGTSILGAAKLTGKVGNNWNVGTVQAVTGREMGEYAVGDQRFKTEVEPPTYYGVFRLQKEIHSGRQGIGFISTGTTRRFKQDRLRVDMNSSAFSGGVDGWTFLDNSRTWVVTGWGGFSRVEGTRERITNVQENSRHYFQRPDAKAFGVDSNATSLSGYAGRILVNKQKGNAIFNSAVGVVSPGFDVNDLGWMWRADVINAHLGGGYKWTDPTAYFRYLQIIGALFQSYDFDGNSTWRGVFLDTYYEFLNYYGVDVMFAYNPKSIDTRLTRGGPLTINQPGWELNLEMNSDRRKTWVYSLGAYGYTRSRFDWNRNVEFTVEWKPKPNLLISLSPGITWNREFAQYVDTFEDHLATSTYNKRYVFARLNQLEINTSIRINWTFTPRLSFQFFGQPLFSRGDYFDFKELARPRSYDFTQYGAENVSLADGEYTIDPDGSGPAAAYAFDNPDFNIKSFRGNAVIRWEYRPGSTFYLVWTQRRYESDDSVRRFNAGRSFKNLWNASADNILMIKWTYWWNL